MGGPVKGTVTSLSSIFPPEEAQKAAKRVQETFSERSEELDQLQGFLNENSSLVNLVQKLPDQLHQDIMVPFGKAAFFPGRLIHTNEFLVLLGEGYFAERTSKQTVEILRRRGKDLESQIESLKAAMQDLKAEESFFNNTAVEATEGLVEIREEYLDEVSGEDISAVSSVTKHDIPSFSGTNKKAEVEDAEYARILSRFEELEKEELEAQNANEVEEGEVDKGDEADIGHHTSKLSPKPEIRSSEEQTKDVPSIREKTAKDHFKQGISEHLNAEGSKAHPVPNDISANGRVTANRSSINEKIIQRPELKNSEVAIVSQNEVSASTPDIGSNSSKAFTGSIIEHTHNLDSNPREQTSAPASKKVSRFKLQRK